MGDDSARSAAVLRAIRSQIEGWERLSEAMTRADTAHCRAVEQVEGVRRNRVLRPQSVNGRYYDTLLEDYSDAMNAAAHECRTALAYWREREASVKAQTKAAQADVTRRAA